MVVIAPPPSQSPPSAQQAMTESSRAPPPPTAPATGTTPTNNAITAAAAAAATSSSTAAAATNQRYNTAAHAPYNNAPRKSRPYSQYSNGLPRTYTNNNGYNGLLTNHNHSGLYHHCTFPCSATSVLTGGDAALPTRFSFGPGFEPQQQFLGAAAAGGGVSGGGQYRSGAGGAAPRVPQQQQLQQQQGGCVGGGGGGGNSQEHIVLFHVNPGVTIRFQIGEKLEVLRGPVTVPMVSTNSAPPIAMPIQVPVGHMVQQIVDERGTLRHVILSPTHPANLVPMPPHQHYGDGTTSNGTSPSPHPAAQNAAALPGYHPAHHHHHHQQQQHHQQLHGGAPQHHLYGQPTAPNGGLSPSGYGPPLQQQQQQQQQHGPHHHHHTPHYHTNMPPPPGGGGGGGGVQGGGSPPPGSFYNKDERTQRQYNKLRKKLNDKRKGGGGGGTNSSSSSTSSSSGGGGISQSQQAANQRLRQTGGMVMLVKEKVGGMNSVGTSEDGEESSSVQEDDDTLLADMLSSVQAPTVSELSSRSALLQWAIPPAVSEHNAALALALTTTSTTSASSSSSLSTAGGGSSTASSLSPASSVTAVSGPAPTTTATTTTTSSSSASSTSSAAIGNSPVMIGSVAAAVVDLPEINEARLRYEVLLSDADKGRRFKSIYSGRSLSCRIQDLRPGQEYTVCLQVHLEELRGTATDPIRFITPGCEPDQPSPPLLNSRKKNSLQLRWNAPENDNGSHILHYILESSTTTTTSNSSSGATFTEAYRGKARTYTLQKLPAATPHRLRLCAVNGLGASAWSEVVCYRTLESAPAAPEVPRLAAATVTALHVRWERRETDGGGFTLEMESDSVRYMPVYNGDGTEFHLRDLAACTEYKFRLAASNEGGCSPWSEEARFSTRPAPPAAPAKPTVRGRIGAHSFRLGWEAPHKTGGAPVTEYTLELNSGTGFEPIYTGPGTDTACTALTPGTTYQARVSCASLGGHSAASDPCTVTTEAVTPAACPPPALKAATKPADRYVILAVQAPDYNGGAPVLEYEVARDGGDGEEEEVVYRGRELECMVANLLPGTTYTFTTRAINRLGAGAWSAPFSVCTAAAVPDAPGHLAGVCRTPHSAQLEWRTPAANGAPITEYRLEYCTQAEFAPAEVVTVASVADGACTTHEIHGLAPHTTYHLRLAALNATGPSPPTPALTLTTPPSTPATPTSLRCEPTPTTLLITWATPSNHGAPITHYNVDVGDVTYTTDTAEPELLVEELGAECAYRVRVQACNAVGAGGYSSVLRTGTLKMPPEAPRVECVAVQWNSLKLKWGEGKNQDYTTYHLEMLNPFTRDYQCVFRGTNYTCKVNKLHESTLYHFRICAASDAGRGPWSVQDWAFETAVAPPAAVRAPRLVDMDAEQRVCTVEWAASVRAHGSGSTSGDGTWYVLQVASVGGRRRGEQKEHEFKEVYRGPDTRHTLDHRLDPHLEYHARVSPIRLCANGDSLTGPQSPTLTFSLPTAAALSGAQDAVGATGAAATASACAAATSPATVARAAGARGGGGAQRQQKPLGRRAREWAKTFAESYKVQLFAFLVVFVGVLIATIFHFVTNNDQ